MQPNTPVGIIGLGLMGTALSGRLIEADLPLIGFDIEPARRANLKAAGGMVATSVREFASRSERLLLPSIVESRSKRCSAILRTPRARRGQP
jgi:putative dehydrogenase